MLDWVPELFETIDNMDPDRFALFLTEDATFRFGNSQPVKGKQKVRDAVLRSSQALKESTISYSASGRLTTSCLFRKPLTHVKTIRWSQFRSSTCSK